MPTGSTQPTQTREGENRDQIRGAEQTTGKRKPEQANQSPSKRWGGECTNKTSAETLKQIAELMADPNARSLLHLIEDPDKLSMLQSLQNLRSCKPVEMKNKNKNKAHVHQRFSIARTRTQNQGTGHVFIFNSLDPGGKSSLLDTSSEKNPFWFCQENLRPPIH